MQKFLSGLDALEARVNEYLDAEKEAAKQRTAALQLLKQHLAIMRAAAIDRSLHAEVGHD